jgi:hypothetical protein
VLVTERGRRDEAQACANVRRHKCVAPLQRSIRDALAPTTGRARHVGAGLKALLQEAVQRWPAYRAGSVPDVPTEATALPEELP